ncbi:MAG: helix-turn-helix domain-containing protein [Betaproteobacteria bacterium]|nr:helix-turn-helix domain-containing protein [Betaproteobacteria bacterium]
MSKVSGTIEASESNGHPGGGAPAAPGAPAADAAATSAATVPQGAAMTPGQHLRQAREAMGQSVADIATRLRMGAKQIQALESGDYAALPTGTFLRGFVRNYAKAVGLDPATVLSSLESSHMPARAVQATPVVEPARQRMQVREATGLFASPQAQGALIALVILLLGVAVAYWWTNIRATAVRTASSSVPAPAGEGASTVRGDAKTEPARSPDVAAVPADAAQPSVVANPALDAEQAKLQPPPAAPIAPPVSPVTAAPIPEKPAEKSKPAEPEKKPRTAGSSVVGFTFTGDSWVEVTDANGRVVLSRKFRAGDAEEASGRGPLSIVIGNASNTRMALNGLEFDLAPHTRGAVARVNAK